MGKKYPDNHCVCNTDDEWAGRNLLRDAFAASAGTSRSRTQHGMNANGTPHMVEKIDHDTPLYWMIENPATYRRQYFSPEAAEIVARPIRAFLAANGVNVTDEGPGHPAENFWKDDPDLVSVYSNGGWLSSYAGTNDPATVAMLPHMQRTLWNLVRFHDEEYKF